MQLPRVHLAATSRSRSRNRTARDYLGPSWCFCRCWEELLAPRAWEAGSSKSFYIYTCILRPGVYMIPELIPGQEQWRTWLCPQGRHWLSGTHNSAKS